MIADVKSHGPMLLSQMLDCLGVDLGGSVVPRLGSVLISVFYACQSCDAAESCSDWLAHPSADHATPPKFCINQDILAEVLAEPSLRRGSIE